MFWYSFKYVVHMHIEIYEYIHMCIVRFGAGRESDMIINVYVWCDQISGQRVIQYQFSFVSLEFSPRCLRVVKQNAMRFNKDNQPHTHKHTYDG